MRLVISKKYLPLYVSAFLSLDFTKKAERYKYQRAIVKPEHSHFVANRTKEWSIQLNFGNSGTQSQLENV